MQILDRYITRDITKIFIGSIFLFSFLYVLIDITSSLDEIISRKIPLLTLIEYYLSYLPIIFVQISTICCLIATLFTYSHLNNSNEIIVLRTSGMDFWSIAKPAIVFGLVVSVAVFWLNEKIVPEATAKNEKIRSENFVLKVDRKSQSKIKNLTFYGLKNRLYFIDTFDPQTYDIEGITIIAYDKTQNLLEKTVALNGKWTGLVWKFYQCHVTTFDSASLNASVKVKIYPEKLMDTSETPRPEDFVRQRLNVSSMNIKELQDYITRFSQSGVSRALNNLRVDLYSKYALPVGNFIVILVGLPLSMMTGRRKAVTFTSLGIAIAIGFLYYVCNAVGLALGKGGLLDPFLSAWLAPLIFTGIAFYMIETKF